MSIQLDQEYIDRMSKARKIQVQALAILKRSVSAGIPKQFMRIPESVLLEMLEPLFYKNKNVEAARVAKFIYQEPNKLFDRRFILIDGSDAFGLSLKKAGFAILFRMIACDKIGRVVQGGELVHTLDSFTSAGGLSRNDYIEDLKTVDVLLIEGIGLSNFRTNFEGGSYMDDLLEYRFMHELTTIISFSKPISSKDGGHDGSQTVALCGKYLYQLMHADVPELSDRMKNDLKTLRIRVK